MKIGVISDTHGSLRAWRAALQGPLRDAKLILHAGDVLYHGPRNPLPGGYDVARLVEEINACPIPVAAVRGNCDSEVDQMVLQVSFADPYFYAEEKVGRIFMAHGHQNQYQFSPAKAREFGADIWINGHTHVYSLTQQEGIWVLNPGSPAMPRGRNPQCTVAWLTDDEIAVADVFSGEILTKVRR